MKKYALSCLLLALPLSVSAADLTGTYKGTGHFGTIRISSRGPNFLLTTCGSYGGQCLPITAELQQIAPGQFTSTIASLTAYYGDLRCDYPVRLEITQSDTKIYLSEFGPSYFPPSHGCPGQSQLGYSSYVEPEPYSRELN